MAVGGGVIEAMRLPTKSPLGCGGLKSFLLAGVLLLAGPGWAGVVERTLVIDAPASVAAGQDLAVTISASTNAGQGEQVGFLQNGDGTLGGGDIYLGGLGQIDD